MFMPKRPLSVTLDENNLLWLRGRAALTRRRSLSDTLDDIVTAARTGGHGAIASRSVAGTIDIADIDPGLDTADAYIRSTVQASLGRPMVVRERRVVSGASATRRSGPQKSKRRG
jgi:hypothetical protein